MIGSLDPVLVLAAVSAVLLMAGIVIAATQVARSAGKSNDHLERASALSASAFHEPAPNGAAALQAHFGIPGAAFDDGPATDESPRAIFALLTEYYAANISQGNTMFWASLLSMSIGFAIIFAGIIGARTNTTAAILTTVAGVLTQFIAATFLAALRSIQAQSATYAQNLVELHLRDVRAADDARATALGLRLLDAIGADGSTALANSTRAALATGLILKQPRPEITLAPIVRSESIEPPQNARTGADATTRAKAQSVSLDETRKTAVEPATPPLH